MKRDFLKLICLLSLAAVTACKGSPTQSDTTTSFEVQNGDLLLVALPLDYDFDSTHAVTNISRDTGEALYVHIAIIERAGDSLHIIDATIAHGVDRHPLDTLLKTFTLKDGSHPRLDLYRLNDTTGAASFIAKAKAQVGRKYNMTFSLSDSGRYCSQLVHNSYVGADTLFPLCGMDFRCSSGEVPTYWSGLFRLIQLDLPQGRIGILPQDIAQSPRVHLVRRNFTR